MPVKFNNSIGAHYTFTPSLQDFKKAFSLTGKGEFRHSVQSTKGELYVDKSGKLCSANIHGGRGTVQSSETNRAIRQALIAALTAKGASKEYIDKNVLPKLYPELYGNGPDANPGADAVRLPGNDRQPEAIGAEMVDMGAVKDGEPPQAKAQPLQDEPALKRSVVKTIIQEFETSQANEHNRIRSASDKIGDMKMAGLEGPQLSLEDFRYLARKCRDVGSGQGEKAEFYEALRTNLFNVIEKAPVPKGRENARLVLLMHLRLTLTARENLKTPLSEEEFLGTMEALDRNMCYVEPHPKPLAERKIANSKATGSKEELARLKRDQKDYEKKAGNLDWFLQCFHDVIPPRHAQVVCKVCELFHELSVIARQALDHKKVDVVAARKMLGEKSRAFADSFVGKGKNAAYRDALESLRGSFEKISEFDSDTRGKYEIDEKDFGAIVNHEGGTEDSKTWYKDLDFGGGAYTVDVQDLLVGLMEDVKPSLELLGLQA